MKVHSAECPAKEKLAYFGQYNYHPVSTLQTIQDIAREERGPLGQTLVDRVTWDVRGEARDECMENPTEELADQIMRETLCALFCRDCKDVHEEIEPVPVEIEPVPLKPAA